jgi:hypothetical protein
VENAVKTEEANRVREELEAGASVLEHAFCMLVERHFFGAAVAAQA